MIPEVGLAADLLGTGEELPAVGSVDGSVGDAVEALLLEAHRLGVDSPRPCGLQRRLPAAPLRSSLVMAWAIAVSSWERGTGRPDAGPCRRGGRFSCRMGGAGGQEIALEGVEAVLYLGRGAPADELDSPCEVPEMMGDEATGGRAVDGEAPASASIRCARESGAPCGAPFPL